MQHSRPCFSPFIARPADADFTRDAAAMTENPLLRFARAVLDLFSNVRLGIVLLSLLFLYCSIGSAGILYPTSFAVWDLDNWAQIVPRQGFSIGPWEIRLELTEFEWFHWWPFNLLIALICTNIVVTTLRRIRLNLVNLGVWMIHTGIIVLAVGSVWYFTAKVEGDAPVSRRDVVVTLPTGESGRMLVKPGNQIAVGEGDARHDFRIVSINPNWELRSGPDAGDTAYSVQVEVRGPERTFIRQLLAGYPEFTEDVLPGQGRAVKATGEKLVDPELDLRLEYSPQQHLYLTRTDALYIREVGASEWAERPIDGLPRYFDYISSYSEVIPADPSNPPDPDPLAIAVPAVHENDPWPEATLKVASYLRYAVPQTRRAPGGAFDPYLSVRVDASTGQREFFEKRAFDHTDDEQTIDFRWVESEAEFDQLARIEPGVVRIEVPSADAEITVTTDQIDANDPDPPYQPIEGTDYEVRVRGVSDNLRIQQEGTAVSVAIVDVRTGHEAFTRWVFDDPALNRDQRIDEDGHATPIEFDDAIEMSYEPGRQPPMLLFVGGPAESRLRLAAVDPSTGGLSVVELREGQTLSIAEGVTLTVTQFLPRSHEVTIPAIVPLAQRNRDLDMKLRMIRVELPGKDGPVSRWLEFNDWPFPSESDTPRRFTHTPKVVTLSDGRQIELMFSRQREKLPAPVVLEDFELETHFGGFTGQTASIRDWRSIVRFMHEDGLTDRHSVAVNAPAEYQGYWFFQSMWDPPDQARGPNMPASAGLNYTVLGVGNREGVFVQLFGCVLAVIGMLYAFYVKPVIKRRRQQAVFAEVAAATGETTADGQEPLATPRRWGDEEAEVATTVGREEAE